GTASLVGAPVGLEYTYSWTGPSDHAFKTDTREHSTIVQEPGQYVLTVTSKSCSYTDTVDVYPCTLTPMDTTVAICANASGEPSHYNGYNLTLLDDYVYGIVQSQVFWFSDPLFLHA